jgi:hypothetical protein
MLVVKLGRAALGSINRFHWRRAMIFRLVDLRMSTAAAICFIPLAISAPARAATVTVQLNGHVVSASPSNIDITGVFGAPNTDLTGAAYSATITYNTAAAPPDSNSNPNFGLYERDYPIASGQSFLSIAVTINGHTETVAGLTNYQRAQIDSFSPNSLYFATSNGDHNNSVGSSFDTSFADFDLTGKAGQQLITGDALPTTVNLNGCLSAPVRLATCRSPEESTKRVSTTFPAVVVKQTSFD